MEKPYLRQLQEQRELREKANEALSLMGKRVQAFRDALSSYLIPEEGIEKYVGKFTRRREEIVNLYIARRVESSKDYLGDAAGILVELGVLDSAAPGELNLEGRTVLEREYLRDMMRANIELLQEASAEYLQ